METPDLLTIAIPTYNRPEKLLRTLKIFINSTPSYVRILVVDNASEIEMHQFILEHFPHLPDRVSFHRNRGNIGLVANICRCYELVETPWIWTVGDDDNIISGSITEILNEIELRKNQESLLGINFSTSLFSYQDTRTLRNLAEYWEVYQNPMAFSNALFLASCVFRIDNVLKYIRVGYQQAFTAASHIAIPIAALNDGLEMCIAKPIIVEVVPAEGAEGWNWVSVMSGIPILAEMPGDSVTIHGISRPLAHFAPGLRFRSGLKLIFSDSARDPSYWYIYYSRLVPCLKGRERMIAAGFRMLSALMFRLPMIRRFLIHFINFVGVEPFNSAQGTLRL